jgi:hypothetical protein
MTKQTEPGEFAAIVAQLRDLLAWLDKHGYSHAAIDVNSALERLSTDNLKIDGLLPPA